MADSTKPLKPIDWDKVEKFLMAGCEGTEIAPHFDMHPETFYHRVHQHYGIYFTELKSQKRNQGKSILRAKQYEKALKGDNSMLIWCGKNLLEQKEGHDHRIEASLNITTVDFSNANTTDRIETEREENQSSPQIQTEAIPDSSTESS